MPDERNLRILWRKLNLCETPNDVGQHLFLITDV